MHKQYHLASSPIPEGHRIFEERLDVAGVYFRSRSAMAFARGKDQALLLELEPDNQADRNAIKVIGIWKGWLFNRRGLIGYLPRDLAAKLVNAGVASKVKARLLKTYVGKHSQVEISIQLVGPKELHASYHPKVETVASLAKAKSDAGQTQEAELDLMRAVIAAENEAEKSGYGITARAFLDLAKHYRKNKQPSAEIAILERFAAHRSIARGRNQEEALNRLSKLKGNTTSQS